MKLPSFDQWSTSLAVALIAALGVRLVAGEAGWVELGALVVLAALLLGLRVLSERRRIQEVADAAAELAAETRAESRLTGALEEVEDLKKRVSKLWTMAHLGVVALLALAGCAKERPAVPDEELGPRLSFTAEPTFRFDADPAVLYNGQQNTGCYTESRNPDLISVAVAGEKITSFVRKGGVNGLAPGECRALIPTPLEAERPCDRAHIGARWAWWVCTSRGWIELDEGGGLR